MKLLSFLQGKKNFDSDRLIQSVNSQHYFHLETDIVKTLKDSFIESFKKPPFEYYKSNTELAKRHIVDTLILKLLFENKLNSIVNKLTDKMIIDYVSTIKYYLSIEELKVNFIRSFHEKLNQCIVHFVNYHNEGYKNYKLYLNNYKNKTERNKILFDLYEMAFESVKIYFNNIYYDPTDLCVDVYNYVDFCVNKNVLNKSTHKRYNVSQIQLRLNEIRSFETGKIPNKDYFDFYTETKNTFQNYIKNNPYPFTLESKEIKRLLDVFLRFVERDKRKIAREDLSKFFKGDFTFNGTIYRYHDWGVKNNRCLLIYVIYKLSKIGKCNLKIFLTECSKNGNDKLKSIISEKKIKEFIQNFEAGKLPKKHQYVDSIIENIVKHS